MRFSLSTTLVLACALALGVVGCGDDDEPAAGSGGSGGAGTGGAGTGGGGTGGTGGTVETVCGGVTCPALPAAPGGGGLPIPVPMPAGCCTTDNACGIEAAGLLKAGVCLEQDAPGVPSTECEGESLMLSIPLGAMPISISLDLAPCCRPDGACGLGTITSPLLAVAGLTELDLGAGCVERANLAASLDTMMLMSGALDWTAASCTPTTDMDAGTGDDAGN